MGLWFSTHPGGIRLYRRPYFPVSLSFQVQLSLLGSLLLIFFRFIYFLIYMCMSVLPKHISVYHMPAWSHRSWTKAMDPLEL